MSDKKPWDYRGYEITPFWYKGRQRWMFWIRVGKKTISRTKAGVRAYIDTVLEVEVQDA